jgi:hypothetical protein
MRLQALRSALVKPMSWQNDQSLSGTPTSSGMSYVMVSLSPMQINFTSATMLTLDSQGQQYSLFDGDGDSVFESISGWHPKVLAVIVEKEAALVMAIELTSAGQVDTAYSAIGPNTDPTAMPALGSAQYTGTVNAALQPSVTPSAQLSKFSGTGTFNVDFTANTVSGSMVYRQSSDPQFTPGSTILTATLPSTSITKNTFETGAGTAQFNQIPNHGTSFGPMRIEGDFFGETGGTLAGVFDGAGAYSSGNAAYLHGGFVTKKIRAVRPLRPVIKTFSARRSQSVNPGLHLLKPAVDIVAHQARCTGYTGSLCNDGPFFGPCLRQVARAFQRILPISRHQPMTRGPSCVRIPLQPVKRFDNPLGFARILTRGIGARRAVLFNE